MGKASKIEEGIKPNTLIISKEIDASDIKKLETYYYTKDILPI